MKFGAIQFDLGTMVLFSIGILLAVLAANGRLQNVINAFNGTTMPQPVGVGVAPIVPGLTAPVGTGVNF